MFILFQHHTKVGSLSISNCHGEDIEVRNLSSSIIISIPHVNHKVMMLLQSEIELWAYFGFRQSRNYNVPLTLFQFSAGGGGGGVE